MTVRLRRMRWHVWSWLDGRADRLSRWVHGRQHAVWRDLMDVTFGRGAAR